MLPVLLGSALSRLQPQRIVTTLLGSTIMADHDFTEQHAIVLRAHARSVAHVRQQITTGRFCLVFGAGAGYDLGFPQWPNLLDRVGEGLEGYDDAKSQAEGEVSLAQLLTKLFEYDFARERPPPPLSDAQAVRDYRAEMHAAWRNRLYDALYRNVDVSEGFVEQSSYYRAFLEVIKQSPVTITYNFDDSIERYLASARTAAEKSRKRGYTTVYDENSQLPTLAPVIYHPNGFLAHVKTEKPSTQLVLSEEAFGEQLADSISGRNAVIHSELTQKTCLFVGCSLNDPTLAYVLRRSATHHPGHFHYYVHWTGQDGSHGPCPPSYSERLFELYNLITLNLSTREILLLGDLVSYPHEFLHEAANDHGIDLMFTYLVTGAVGAGKSSVISHFRSLRQHDEWLEPRFPGMEQAVDLLDDEYLRMIDEWVDQQFALKNRVLHAKENAIGVHILDRGPLDPLAFTKDGRIDRRAKRLHGAITRSKLQRAVVPAHVILLIGDPDEMAIRAKARGKVFTSSVLRRQQDDLCTVYGDESGTTIIDTRGLTITEVVKRVAAIVHRNDYCELNLDARFEALKTPAAQLFLDVVD